jgi:hypothetical protein
MREDDVWEKAAKYRKSQKAADFITLENAIRISFNAGGVRITDGEALWNREEEIRRLATQAVENTRGFIYAIGGGPFIKIGHARDVDSRLSQLQTGSPFDLVVLERCECNYPDVLEGLWHKRLRKYRKQGEWYSMPKRVQLAVLSMVSRGLSPEKSPGIEWKGAISKCSHCGGRAYAKGWCFKCGRKSFVKEKADEYYFDDQGEFVDA